ncbi:uncharacterized protein LOC114184427 [Vigna unguiculata]|uniref:uncharacterized protein LOC114184427 n=1 Tax=Vigna unguiculata TaxID=3917 RepID=UPI001015DBCF|nr:uncharacterized protein LOC114184427 [Vigna unguiculata]
MKKGLQPEKEHDDQGKRITKQLRTNDVWHLPPNERIVVQWNNQDQPIADGGALLNRFLGGIARNSNSLPISYSSWKMIPKDYKEDVLKNIIQEHALKNKDNRAKKIIAHTCGSKSIARKRDEMENECAHRVSRGEVWIATHKHANGAFVSDEVREISEKIQVDESTSSSSVSKEISSTDSLAFDFGSQEHCGRVRGLGLGPCPSKVFSSKGHSYSGTSSSYPSNAQLQNQGFLELQALTEVFETPDIEPEEIRPMENYAVSITWHDVFNQMMELLVDDVSEPSVQA